MVERVRLKPKVERVRLKSKHKYTGRLDVDPEKEARLLHRIKELFDGGRIDEQSGIPEFLCRKLWVV